MSGMCQEELNLFQTENDKGFAKILDENVRNEFGMALRKFEEGNRDIKVWINTIKVLLREFEYEENNDFSHNNKQKTEKQELQFKKLKNILVEEFQEVEKANGKILVAFEDNDIEELDDEGNDERSEGNDERSEGIDERSEGNNERNEGETEWNDLRNESNGWNKEGKFQKILQLVSIEMACIERELKESFKDLDDSSPLKGHKKLERSETQKKREIEEDELNKLYVAKRKIVINVDNGRLNKVFDKLKVSNEDDQMIKTLLLYMNFYVEAYNINKESLVNLSWLKDIIIKIGAEINWLSEISSGRKKLIDIVKKEWSDGNVKMYLYKNLKNGITEYDKINDSMNLDYSESEKSLKHKQDMVILSTKERKPECSHHKIKLTKDCKGKKKMIQIKETLNKNKHIMHNESKNMQKEAKEIETKDKGKLSVLIKNEHKNKSEARNAQNEHQLVPVNITNKRILAPNTNKSKKYSFWCC
uniref:Uncharacterized protein n=1 Tax=Meloidogyne floridensis TaxID=298350 RepID=A0A915NYW6_9BILA